LPLLLLVFLLFLSAPSFPADESVATPGAPGEEVLERYLAASVSQQEYLRGLQMDADFEANVPSLNRASKLHALRYISKIGRITYRVLSSQGDTGVRKEVIIRYIESEMHSAQKRGIGINRENYKFSYRGKHGSGDWQLHLFELTPREKRVGLFRGWLWVEAKSGVPVREQGQFVKSPSIWLRKISFVRDYDFKGGKSIPSVIQTVVETRVVGRAELKIRYTNVQPGEPPADQAHVARLRASSLNP
jgi:hypothetical protein